MRSRYFWNGQLRKGDLRARPILTPDVIRAREELRMARYWTSVQHTGEAERKAADTGWLVALFWMFEALNLGDE